MTQDATTIGPEYVNAKDAARVLGISTWRVYQLAKLGTLRAYQAGGRGALLFRLDDVRAVVVPRGEPVGAGT